MRRTALTICFSLIASSTVLRPAPAASAPPACPPVPPVVTGITANDYYTDARHSEIDPARKAANAAAVAPIESFLHQVAFAASAGSDRGQTCAVHWLAVWAEGKALTGPLSGEQAAYERKWTLAGLALSYARVRAAAPDEDRATIDNWLIGLARQVAAHSDAHRGTRNNHYYWEGLAVAATGAVTGDATAQQWGKRVFHDGLSQIAPDGSLPAEMARGQRALHYHLFATAPLVMLAAISGEEAPALDRLVQFCMAALDDPQSIARRTQVAQVPATAANAAWLWIYARRHPQMIRQETEKGGITLPPHPFDARLGGALDRPNPVER